MSEADKPIRKAKSFDLINITIGDFGKWQCRISILMALLKLPIAWFQLGIVFLAPPTDFWCKPPPEYKNLSAETWKELIIPYDNLSHRDSHMERGYCKMLDADNYSLIDCPWGYDYNRTVVYSSIISEWNLVCGRERLIDVTQITLMFGVLIGSLIFGIAADKVGRKPVLMFCIFVQSICGILSSISPWFGLFLLLRFLLAIANGGTMIVSFVMCMEIVGGKWRTIVPILYQIPFGIGNSLMSLIAYLLRDWREFQFTLSALSTFYMAYICIVPESPRWLLAIGKREEAYKILEKAIICNGNDPNTIRKHSQEFEDRCMLPKKIKMISFFQSSEIQRRTLLLCFNWFMCGISFFAFSQYLGQVSSNLYFAVAVGGAISMPGTCLCIYIIKRCGRKVTIAFANVMTAFCFVAILFVHKGVYYQDWPRVLLASLGIVGMSISLPALYLFTCELYPTVVRNAGLGSAVMCSKVGSMMAPLVISLSDIETYIPLLLLGFLSIMEAVLVLPLPETLDRKLPETIQDIENFGRNENEEN